MLFSHTVICHYCRRGKDGHRDVSGACKAFERSDHPPFGYAVAREQPAAAGWRLR